MLKHLKHTILLSLAFCSLSYSQFWTPTGALSSINAQYLTAAAHVGDNIFAIGNNQGFSLSTDAGVTWTAPTINAPNGTFAALYGTSDRIYANMKINNFDFELHYSTDNGSSWAIDTAGLPKNITASGKASMMVEYMGDNYVVAYNSTSARYKKLGDPSWTITTIDNVIIDVTAMNGNWFAIGTGKLLKSTDKGVSWNPISTSGLPSGFQGLTLVTNDKDRMFISEPPAAGGEEIYFSTDEGVSWSTTNSAGQFTHTNPWVGAMYAVGNYLFAAISPEFANVQDPPPFLISSTQQPNFTVGDTSGIARGGTTTAFPFFFHINDKLFTIMGELYVSTPGFAANIGIKEQQTEVTLFPNPTHNYIQINVANPHYWQVLDISGKPIIQGNNRSSHRVSLEGLTPGVYFITIFDDEQHYSQKIIKI